MPLQVSESIELFGPVLLKRSSDQNAAKETFLSFTGGRDKEKDSLFCLCVSYLPFNFQKQ